MRQREGVINLKLTNSKNKVMASSHLHLPPIFFSLPCSCSTGYGWENRFNYCCFQLFHFISCDHYCFSLFFFCSFNYRFIGVHFFFHTNRPPSLYLNSYTLAPLSVWDFFFFFLPRKQTPYPGSLHITRSVPGEPVALQGWERKTDMERKQ